MLNEWHDGDSVNLLQRDDDVAAFPFTLSDLTYVEASIQDALYNLQDNISCGEFSELEVASQRNMLRKLRRIHNRLVKYFESIGVPRFSR